MDVSGHGLKLKIMDGEERVVTVVLGADFDVEEGPGVVVADYARQTLHEVGPGGETRSSLWALWSFRFFEYHNRLFVGRTVAAGGPTEWHPFVPALSRHALSQVEADGDLDEPVWDGDNATLEGRTVFAADPGSVEVSASVRARLARYLRRTLCGHPGIYARVFGARVPRRFRFQFSQDERQVEVEVLEDLGPTERLVIDLPELNPDDALQACIDEARASGPFGPADEEHAMERLKGFVGADQWVPAFLSIMEWSWCRTPLPEKMQNAVGGILGLDPRLERLMAVLQGQTDLEPDAKAAEIYALRPAAGELGHCLDVFVGSLRMHEDPTAGEAALLKALSQNPRLAGPYHDLGLIYAGAYDFRRAYRCWDFVRWLSPGFAMMSDVERREADVWAAERRVPVGSMALSAASV
ncbi:MAG: hypothetical protein H6737_24195 [Alphaproteobacteria bacterium]|nr:hypothetical protein [Alphaproteobacteria bacterium]